MKPFYVLAFLLLIGVGSEIVCEAHHKKEVAELKGICNAVTPGSTFSSLIKRFGTPKRMLQNEKSETKYWGYIRHSGACVVDVSGDLIIRARFIPRAD